MKYTIAAIMIIMVVILAISQTASAATISVEPPCQKVASGEIFTVNITVYPEGSEVFGASYTLYFNNTLLNATGLTQGTFLSQDGAETYLWVDEINNTLGKVEYAESRKKTTSGVNTSGVLTTITFQAIAERGLSGLHLSDLEGVILSDPDGYPILTNVSNGSVRIGMCGDVDGNGKVDSMDYVTLRAYVVGAPGWTITSEWAADVDCNTKIDSMDYVTLRAYIVGAPGWGLNCCCG